MNGKKSVFKYILWILLILSPIVLLAVESLIYGQNLFMGVPEWSDELDYWREMYSFSRCGFDFGGSLFFGYDAQVGPLGAHSFSPIAAWGLFSGFFASSMGSHAIVWINLAMLTVAWLIFVLLVKPDYIKSIIAIALAYLFPLTVLYIHSSMIELVCMAGLIVYFALLYRWKIEEEKDKKAGKWFLIALLVGIWCTMLRPTYVVILFPAIWMKNKFKINKYTIISMIAYVVAFGVFYNLYGMLCADYPDWVTSKISAAVGIRNKLSIVYHNAIGNLKMYFGPKSADLCQVGMRYFYFVIMLFAGVRAFVGDNDEKAKQNGEENSVRASEKNPPNRLYLSIFIMMFGLWAMMILLYDIIEWRDFRAFAPICFGATLLMVLLEKGKKSLGVLSAVYACLLISFFVSGINFVETKNYEQARDLSAYFEMLETEDENGEPRTLAADFELNWCDISVLGSVPAKLGYQVFYGSYDADVYGQADYVFAPFDMEIDGEPVSTVPGYGIIYKMFE